jgi:ATP-dependent Clp protease adaptor protein ClpS
MEFVVEVLMKVIGCPVEQAFQLMLEAHTSGRAVVWTGPREVAELKAEQIQTFHEVRDHGVDLGPLGCTVEPAPGA